MNTPTKKTEISTSSGHYYAGQNSPMGPPGTPVYTVPKKDGSGPRNTTIADARKLNLVPSVTTVCKILDKPALAIWLQNQAITSALKLTREPDEDEATFRSRILADSKELGREAADRGTACHGAIERYIQGQSVDPEWMPHVQSTETALKAIGIDLMSGTAERSFSHPDGFGGKIDLCGADWIVDFKTKADLKDDTKKLAWDEHLLQLASYSYGLGQPPRSRLINVFIGVDDAKAVCVEHDPDEAVTALAKFKLVLAYFKLDRKLP